MSMGLPMNATAPRTTIKVDETPILLATAGMTDAEIDAELERRAAQARAIMDAPDEAVEPETGEG